MLAQDEHERLLAELAVRASPSSAGSAVDFHEAARASLPRSTGRPARPFPRRLRRRELHRAPRARPRVPGRHVRRTCSTSPTSRPRAQAPTASCRWRSTRAVFAAFPWPGTGTSASSGRSAPDGRAHESRAPAPVLSWHDVDKSSLARIGLHVRDVQLVLDVPRSPPRRQAFRRGPRVPARRRRAHPQPRGRAGHEHRDRRRLQPRVEARRRGERAGARLAARYLRPRAARLRRAPRRDDRSPVHAGLARAARSRARCARTACPACCRGSSAPSAAAPSCSRPSRRRALRYRKSPLSEGHAGVVHAGDRLPWFAQAGDGSGDNFAPLRSRWWQAHVYGAPKPGRSERSVAPAGCPCTSSLERGGRARRSGARRALRRSSRRVRGPGGCFRRTLRRWSTTSTPAGCAWSRAPPTRTCRHRDPPLPVDATHNV